MLCIAMISLLRKKEMIEEIKKYKPQCATHWCDGRYYIKTINSEWLVYFEGGWFPSHPNDLCMTLI